MRGENWRLFIPDWEKTRLKNVSYGPSRGDKLFMPDACWKEKGGSEKSPPPSLRRLKCSGLGLRIDRERAVTEAREVREDARGLVVHEVLGVAVEATRQGHFVVDRSRRGERQRGFDIRAADRQRATSRDRGGGVGSERYACRIVRHRHSRCTSNCAAVHETDVRRVVGASRRQKRIELDAQAATSQTRQAARERSNSRDGGGSRRRCNCRRTRSRRDPRGAVKLNDDRRTVQAIASNRERNRAGAELTRGLRRGGRAVRKVTDFGQRAVAQDAMGDFHFSRGGNRRTKDHGRQVSTDGRVTRELDGPENGGRRRRRTQFGKGDRSRVVDSQCRAGIDGRYDSALAGNHGSRRNGFEGDRVRGVSDNAAQRDRGGGRRESAGALERDPSNRDGVHTADGLSTKVPCGGVTARNQDFVGQRLYRTTRHRTKEFQRTAGRGLEVVKDCRSARELGTGNIQLDIESRVVRGAVVDQDIASGRGRCAAGNGHSAGGRGGATEHLRGDALRRDGGGGRLRVGSGAAWVCLDRRGLADGRERRRSEQRAAKQIKCLFIHNFRIPLKVTDIW